MILHLKQQTLMLAGTFNQPHNKATLIQMIQDAGGKITKAVNTKTTAVVLGQSYMKMNAEHQAIQRGLPVLTEAQLLTFLDKGHITLVEEVTEAASLDHLIAEARAVLDGEVSPAQWNAIVALVDSCDPDYAEAFVDYLLPICERWHVGSKTRYKLGEFEEHHIASWLENAPFGFMRLVPSHWMTEVVQNQQHPKYRLANVLVCSGLSMSNKDIIALISSEHFSHITYVDVGGPIPKLSMTVFKKLAMSPMAAQVNAMRFTMFNSTLAKALKKPGALRLEQASFSYYHEHYDDDALQQLLASPWLENIHTLTLDASVYNPSPTRLFRDAVLPKLRHGIIKTKTIISRNISTLNIMPDVESLSFQGTVTTVYPDKVSALLDTPITAKAVDFSGIDTHSYFDPAELQAHFFNHLPQSTLCSNLTSIHLGRWCTPALKTQFEAEGVACT